MRGGGAFGGRVEGAMARGPGRPCARLRLLLLLQVMVSAVGRGRLRGPPTRAAGRRSAGLATGCWDLSARLWFSSHHTRDLVSFANCDQYVQ